MKASDIYWDRAALKKFLHSPRQVIPGNRMAFPGFKNDEDLEAILSFLEENAR